MKRNLLLFSAAFVAVICSVGSISAQLRLPQMSPKATVTQSVGVTDIAITYSRPMVKGRTIWADPPADKPGEATLDDSRNRPAGTPIVFYGKVWRTGANEATLFSVTDDFMINGQSLAAGKYSLHTIPGKDEWTIILNKDDGQWGSFRYDAKKDAIRFKAKPQWLSENQEALLFTIDPATPNSAVITIAWEKVRVPFIVSFDLAATTLPKAKIAVAAAKADDWSTPYRAAGFANDNGDKASAATWIVQALKAVDTSISAGETWANLQGKTNILLSAGRKDEALALADRAIATGKTQKADATALAAFEKRIAELKVKK